MTRTLGSTILLASAVLAVVMAYALRPRASGSTTAAWDEREPRSPESAVVPLQTRPASVRDGRLKVGGAEVDVRGATIPVSAVVDTDVAPAELPPLTNPPVVSAASGDAPHDGEMVAGVVVDGVARAYSLPILSYHWVANDLIDGRAVVILYDPIAGSATAYQATLDRKPLTFAASGKFYQGNSLFHEQTTGSLFLAATGRFVAGVPAGRPLAPLPLWRERWETWREREPNTGVLSRQTGYTRPYQTDPYAKVTLADGSTVDYQESPELLAAPTISDAQQRLPAKTRVLGFVTREGEAHCCAIDELLEDETGTALRIDGTRVVRLRDGHARVSFSGGVWPQQVVCYYFAWYGVHPDTRVWPLPPRPATTGAEPSGASIHP